MRTLIYVRASNDVNDNPRRGWIIPGVGTGHSDVFVDEGLMGRNALYTHLHMPMENFGLADFRLNYDKHVVEVVLNVTVSQYNKLKRGK